MVSITSAVGLDAPNEQADVHTVQKLLNKNRHRIPDMRELSEDRIVGPKTLEAIRAFQTKVLKFRTVDCVVDPDGKTWKALVTGSSGASAAVQPASVSAPTQPPSLDEPIAFPLRNRNVPDYHVPRKAHEHHRYFGAPRKTKEGAYRAHAGCDLIAAHGTPVLAVDDGEVLLYEPGFFDVTDALQVKHDNGLVIRYGEVKAAPGFAKPKTAVRRGQVIAYVEKNTKGTAMLHIEFYAGTKEGRLSQPGNMFRRRSDLLNPTSYLDEAKNATS
jgi:murein DD-endopeptidase MepM/ murein hydrolase activator NlpD